MFDPQAKLIQLPRRVKDRTTGQYVTMYDEYLEVKWRVLMFRETYPHGRILTEEICVDLDRGYARYKATVEDREGGHATGYGTETQADFADFCERAETRAVGRALALAGFGTQFVGQDLTEGEHVADAPVTPPQSPTSAPTNGKGPQTPLASELTDRPTEVHLTALTTLAVVECHEEPEAFAARLRQVMRLKPTASVAPKLLTRTMSMAHYMEVMAYYQRLQQQLSRPDVTQPGNGDGTPAEPHRGPVVAPAQLTAEAVTELRGGTTSPAAPPEVATSAQIRDLRILALRADPTGKAEKDLVESFKHYPHGMPLTTYEAVYDRLSNRVQEAKGSLALAET
jgi:hypothetical protein